ncbi:MAG: hypothetical protein HRU09_08135 [Oligoflexales bacterium]|nr:hypothetical protein [Oligoflexales bacterium]
MNPVDKPLKQSISDNKKLGLSLNHTKLKLKSSVLWLWGKLYQAERKRSFYYPEEKNKFRSEVQMQKNSIFLSKMPTNAVKIRRTKKELEVDPTVQTKNSFV